MAFFSFNPIAETISIDFICPNCCKHSNSGSIYVPQPNYLAETHHDSINSDFTEVSCEHCGATFEVTLNNGYYGGDGEIEGIDKILNVEEEYAGEDDDYYERELYDATHNEIEKTLDNIKGIPEDSKLYLYRLLYANAITAMETYLGDTLKREVLKNENNIRKFVESYKPFSETEVKLSDLFRKKDTLPKLLKETLDGLMYHNLPKIKATYKKALNIDIGEIGELVKAVSIRHDIVHRNGKTKDGKEHDITEVDVKQISQLVKELIQKIEEQLPTDDIFSFKPIYPLDEI